MRELILDKESNLIHLFSGGLDSSYSLLKNVSELKEKKSNATVHPIFFDYGQAASNIEWKRVVKIVKYIRSFLDKKPLLDNPIRISLRSDLFKWSRSDAFKGTEGEKEPEIENRNMVLFSVLASYLIACANHQNIDRTDFKITSGFKDRELPDCNQAFFTQIEELLKMYKPNLTFHIDIMDMMERQEIIKKAKKLLKGDENELEKFRQLTTSCYSPTQNGNPCGECSKCKALEAEKMSSN